MSENLNSERSIEMKAVLITGITGFLGSHLAARLLQEHPEQVVIGLARSRGGWLASERVLDAVRRAWRDQGHGSLPEHCAERVRAWEVDLCASGPALKPSKLSEIRHLEAVEFWHCAACIKLLERLDGSVWGTNVAGTERALDLAGLLGAWAFNYVSTAYVAGTLTGRIPEVLPELPRRFHNIYEESKSHAEHLVARRGLDTGLQYRILRPSIVIGHSQTLRTSSAAGLYRVLDLALKFRRAVEASDPTYFERQPLRMCIDPKAVLNTIPVDLVIDEMLDLSRAGEATLGQVFHLTSETPQNTFRAAATLLRAVGIPRLEPAEDPNRLGGIDRLFAEGLNAYRPYLNGQQVFDRANVIRYGADRYQKGISLDLEHFCSHYLLVNNWLTPLQGSRLQLA
jgi:nucleoside-diphosphate-sugar epimerase